MKIQQNINLLVILLVIIFWMGHTYIGLLFSPEGGSFLEYCFNPNTENLLTRGFFILLVMIFSVFAKKLINSIQDMANELRGQNKQLDTTVKELELLAQTDALTTLINRRKFDEILKYESERSQRYQSNLTLIMCDIDHFKKINDYYGHDSGDKTLKAFSTIITNNIRDIDIFSRYGGDEFMILMPNMNIDDARSVAEKLCKLIEKADIEEIDSFTASFGVTNFKTNDTHTSFMNRADSALYKAKESGRNKVVMIT